MLQFILKNIFKISENILLAYFEENPNTVKSMFFCALGPFVLLADINYNYGILNLIILYIISMEEKNK